MRTSISSPALRPTKEGSEKLREWRFIIENILPLIIIDGAVLIMKVGVTLRPKPRAKVAVVIRLALPTSLLPSFVFLPPGAQSVVLLALLSVREHVVGFIDFLELLFSFLVPQVDVRVILTS